MAEICHFLIHTENACSLYEIKVYSILHENFPNSQVHSECNGQVWSSMVEHG